MMIRTMQMITGTIQTITIRQYKRNQTYTAIHQAQKPRAQCRIKVCGGPRPMSMWGPLTLSKRSATIGWRGAYKKKLG